MKGFQEGRIKLVQLDQHGLQLLDAKKPALMVP